MTCVDRNGQILLIPLTCGFNTKGVLGCCGGLWWPIDLETCYTVPLMCYSSVRILLWKQIRGLCVHLNILSQHANYQSLVEGV